MDVVSDQSERSHWSVVTRSALKHQGRLEGGTSGLLGKPAGLEGELMGTLPEVAPLCSRCSSLPRGTQGFSAHDGRLVPGNGAGTCPPGEGGKRQGRR